MTQERNIYLHDIPLDEAWARFVSALDSSGMWRPLPGEDVPVAEASGRITAEPVWARISAPHYHASAMDGYAVRAEDTIGATETSPILLQEGTPETTARPAQVVNTGHAIPAWADAVIMIEHVQPTADGLLIRAAIPPWQYIRPMGEDMVATELVLPANHLLRPVDLGAIAGCGHATVKVRRKPLVAILATGSELVKPDGELKPGNVIEYNSIVLGAQVESWGGRALRLPPVPDEPGKIRTAAADAVIRHADLVLINAGSAAGSEDHTAAVVESLGELLVHGIAVRPGHPVVLGLLRVDRRAAPVIGVPGYPVSAALTGEILVRPLLEKWLGRPSDPAPTVEGEITRKVLSPTGDDEFLRVSVGRVGGRTLVTPLGRGAGTITSLVRADGIVRIPRFSEGHNAGDRVTVHLYTSPARLDGTVVIIGSHDLTLDLLAQFLAERHPQFRLSSANVGSVGGLLAIKRGQTHLAGCHLLDPATGEYNLGYTKQYAPGVPLRLITLVGREQGLIVPKGNPKQIQGIADLARPDVMTMNRQRGAGTRLLLDHLLAQAGISPEQVRGYEREQITHLAVAASVQSGAADCGMGVLAAARALNLDFVPLASERYDLAVPLEHLETPPVQAALSLLHDADFRAAVAALPGYDVTHMGEVAAEVS